MSEFCFHTRAKLEAQALEATTLMWPYSGWVECSKCKAMLQRREGWERPE